jgi:hypothetical protein
MGLQVVQSSVDNTITFDSHMHEYYLSNISPRWRAAVAHADGLVQVFSPYVTSGTADGLFSRCNPGSGELYTKCSLEDFTSGASSLRTIRHLYESGIRLYEVSRLHAKIVLAESFASIGSQNVTRAGARNKKATVVVTDPGNVGLIWELTSRWVAERRPITLEMIDDAQALLPQLRRMFTAAQRAAVDVEREFRERQQSRAAEIARRAAELRARRKAAQGEVRSVRSRVQPYTATTAIPWELAARFLRAPVWWLTHSSGPVRAPAHADRMYGHQGDWKIDCGANTFLVGRAVARCYSTIQSFLSEAEQGQPWASAELRDRLTLKVRGAVATYNGDEYNGYYPVTNTDMVFGSTSVDVDDFVSLVLRLTEAEELCSDAMVTAAG